MKAKVIKHEYITVNNKTYRVITAELPVLPKLEVSIVQNILQPAPGLNTMINVNLKDLYVFYD